MDKRKMIEAGPVEGSANPDTVRMMVKSWFLAGDKIEFVGDDRGVTIVRRINGEKVMASIKVMPPIQADSDDVLAWMRELKRIKNDLAA